MQCLDRCFHGICSFLQVGLPPKEMREDRHQFVDGTREVPSCSAHLMVNKIFSKVIFKNIGPTPSKIMTK